MDAANPPGHHSVLRDEVLRLLDLGERRVIVDCTTGLGGHAEAMLEAAPADALLIGMDVDESNLLRAKERLARFGSRVRLFQANFADADEVLRQADLKGADAILADLGVASSQLDDSLRGLSFMKEGPLDMRLDQSQRITASILINTLGSEELADLIYRYGEERYSRRIARAIVAAREDHTIDSTTELAEIIALAFPPAVRRTRKGVHVATRTFQALRIAVNREMESLEKLLELLPKLLNIGGRAAVISFHSLEDRPVKQAFANWAASGKARVLTPKPIEATAQEVEWNPRSRSAKLRGVEKVE